MTQLRRTGAAVAAVMLLGSMTAAERQLHVRPVAALTAGAKPDHVVIVVLENKRYDAVIGHRKVPWANEVAACGANLTRFYTETHPSQPNYLALFSGSTQGVQDNKCAHDLGARPNLAVS